MVSALKILFYIIFFVLALFYFLPKNNLYYLLENELEVNKVILFDEVVTDEGFRLNTRNTFIFYDSIDVAKVENMDIFLFGVYNTIAIQNVKLTGIAESFLPVDVRSLDATYSILNPKLLSAYVEGVFGEAKIEVDLFERKIRIHLVASQLMKKQYKSTLRNLKKNENGEYSYVKNF